MHIKSCTLTSWTSRYLQSNQLSLRTSHRCIAYEIKANR